MRGGICPQAQPETSGEASGWQRGAVVCRFGAKRLIRNEKPLPAHRSHKAVARMF